MQQLVSLISFCEFPFPKVVLRFKLPRGKNVRSRDAAGAPDDCNLGKLYFWKYN